MALARRRPGRWIWLFPAVYAAHIADELVVGAGFYTWVGRYAPFSAPSFLFVNAMVVSELAALAWLARARAWGGFAVVAVSVQFALHGLVVHPAFSAWVGRPSPGLVTGALVLLPLAAIGLAWSRALTPREIAAGVVTGLAVFASQDVWRVAFNAFVPVPAG